MMQSGRLVVEKSSVSSSDKVKREATDPPKEFPVIINGFELSICIKIRILQYFNGTNHIQEKKKDKSHSQNSFNQLTIYNLAPNC